MGRSNRQTIPQGIQRDRRSEIVTRFYDRDIWTDVYIEQTHDASVGPVADGGGVADGDVLGVEEELAVAELDVYQGSLAQSAGGGDLGGAAGDLAAGVDAAEEGGLDVGPDDGGTADAVGAGDLDRGGVVDEGLAGVGDRRERTPAAEEGIEVRCRGIRGLAAMEGAPESHEAAVEATRGIELGCEQTQVRGGHVDAAAVAGDALGQVDAGAGEAVARRDGNAPAVARAGGVSVAAADLDDAANRGIGDGAAIGREPLGGDRVGERKRGRAGRGDGAALGAVGRDGASERSEAATDRDGAAVDGGATRGVGLADSDDRAVSAIQNNRPLGVDGEAAGFDHAGMVDDRRGELVGRTGREEHGAAVGTDAAALLDSRIDGSSFDLK